MKTTLRVRMHCEKLRIHLPTDVDQILPDEKYVSELEVIEKIFEKFRNLLPFVKKKLLIEKHFLI